MSATTKSLSSARRARLALALGLLAAASSASACGGSDDAASKRPSEPAWEHPPVGADGAVTEAPKDLGAGALPPTSRGVRRMRIDTLQASMSKVAGTDVYGAPIVWRYGGKDGFSDAAFGKALGRPDFQTSTEESGVSNALYLKFVGDAARDICMQMAKNDLKRSDAAKRALFPKAAVDGSAQDADVTENLRYLILRFDGLRVAADDPMIPALRAVYDAGTSSAPAPNGGELPAPAEGWRGVCVALFESPLFHID